MPTKPSDPARHRAVQPASRRFWFVVLLAFGVIIVSALGVVGSIGWNLARSFDSVEKIPAAFPTADVERPAAAKGPAALSMNFLLLGSDSRGAHRSSLANISGERSDTIVIVHVPADRAHLTVMSIPRDSWLDIPGHGRAKINAALSVGGVPLAVQTVESLIGSRIDHVAVVDFAGFEAVTDALGGVDVDNPIGFESSLNGHTFPQGTQRLNGAEALAFARERYAFTDGDFQRVRNQQLLIRSLLSGVMHKSTVIDPGTMGALIGAVTPHLEIGRAHV